MMQIILGAAALAAVFWILNGYTKAAPSLLAGGARKLGGIAAIGVGGLLLARGRFDIALPLMIFGAGIAGWLPSAFGGGALGGLFGRRTAPSPGQTSQVRSRTLAMELDHDSNTLKGRVLEGRFAGRSLDELQPPDLMTLFREISADQEGRSLLEAYLDRRTPAWRQHFQEDAASRAGDGDGRRHAMTKEEAHQILGVQPGAPTDEIKRAHRTLMKKLHPDQGGSTYLAARVNEARDLLLGRHH